MSDAARWTRIAALLDLVDPTDAAWVRAQTEPAWQARRRRLDARDDAVRAAAAAICGDARPTVAAKELAEAFAAYLAATRTRERALDEPPAASAARICLHRLAHLNGGGPLGWRQILNILEGGRGVAKKTPGNCNGRLAGP